MRVINKITRAKGSGYPIIFILKHLVTRCNNLNLSVKGEKEEGLITDMASPQGIPIIQAQVEKAYKKVRSGGKAAGIDEQSWEDFDKKKEDYLYVIWNRLRSGTYFPQPVREVEIPKKDGRIRKLGIPTLRDRIAQEVLRAHMENLAEKHFSNNSYGYRPLKSAHGALEQVRKNCHQYGWVIDLDIKNFFDEIDHEKMLKAVSHIYKEKWVAMYIKRWLEAPVMKQDGSLIQKQGKGTPQGGVISPLLANLYLHFTLDKWLELNFPHIVFVRYADDVVLHCRSKEEAENLLAAIKVRLIEASLEAKEEKTKIVYCKSYKMKLEYENVQFEFLGFSFQPREAKSHYEGNPNYLAYTAEISQSNQRRIREEIRSKRIWTTTQVDIKAIATQFNLKLRGWLNYYGCYGKRTLRRLMFTMDTKLIKWLKKKNKIGTRKAVGVLNRIKRENPKLFYHWEYFDPQRGERITRAV